MEYKKLVTQVGEDWADFLKPFMCPHPGETTCPYDSISEALKLAYQTTSVLPMKEQVFECFRRTPLSKLRVVILGQDPYFKAGYANGLAFATDNKDLPVSLKQIYDGIEDDVYNGLDLTKPQRDGRLLGPSGRSWMDQGVLMLNTALTVRENEADSHAEIWKPFIVYILSNVWRYKPNLIFIGWGTRAKELLKYEATGNNTFGTDGRGENTGVNIFYASVCTSEHPANASRAKRKWKTDNFSKCNLIIRINNLGEPIDW